MDLADLFQRLGTALGLGLIVGLQRERSGSPLGGFRTFPIVTLFGALTGFLALSFGGWVIASGLLGLALLISIGYSELRRETDSPTDKPGLTTEVAMLLMFAVGAYIPNGQLAIAVAIGGTLAVLLYFKPEMHNIARRLEDPDFRAIMMFVLITLVILPVLPNRNFGPYNVLNPYKIWWMVVLIVGISLTGYLIYKFFGSRIGVLAGGMLGGLISSTATTVSFSRITKRSPESSKLAALVVMLASAIVFIRVIIIIGVTAPRFLPFSWGPFAIMFAVLLFISIILWRMTSKEGVELPKQENPSQLKAALVFAGLYALVLLAVAAAKDYFGSQGLYLVSVLSGLTDMDAITLSVSQMVSLDQIKAGTGWRLVMVASLSNLVFKTGVVAFLGSRALLLRVALLFGMVFAGGIALILLWPA